MSDDSIPDLPPACASCISGRRAFLRDAALLAAGALAAAGLAPAEAAALPTRAIAALARTGNERRYPIPASDGVFVDHAESLMVARAAGKVYVFNLACPHQNTALRWEPDKNRFQCPKHHSRYTPDGTFIEGRATRGLDRFPVKRDGGNVVASIDRMLRQDQDLFEWSTAFISL